MADFVLLGKFLVNLDEVYLIEEALDEEAFTKAWENADNITTEELKEAFKKVDVRHRTIVRHLNGKITRIDMAFSEVISLIYSFQQLKNLK